MVRFVRSAIFEVRPRAGRGCWGTRDKTTLTAATAHVRFPSRLVSAPIVNLRPVLPAASLCCALVALLPLSRQNVEGQTPLHIAVYYGKAELIPILLAAGADVNAKASACASLPRCPPSGWRPANTALRRASAGSGRTVAINRGASSWVPRRWRAQVRGAISVD